MILINTGLPKSGTTILFEYQIDIVKNLFPVNGLEEFKSHNNNTLFIQDFDENSFYRIIEVHKTCGSLVIKTHKPPTPLINCLIKDHNAKVTCCYRDPRDIILSALDHGIRSRAGKHKIPSFAKYYFPKDVLPDLKEWLTIFFEWYPRNDVYMIQYEQFVGNKLNILQEMMKIFNISLPLEILFGIIEKHENTKQAKPIFNKGITNRWRKELADEDLTMIQTFLYKEIVEMGYTLM